MTTGYGPVGGAGLATILGITFTDQSIPNNTFAPFDTIDWEIATDAMGLWDTNVPDTLTFQDYNAGLWRFSWALAFVAAAGGQRRGILQGFSGQNEGGTFTVPGSALGTYQSLGCSWVGNIPGACSITLGVFQDSGAPLSLYAANVPLGLSRGTCWLSAEYLGPCAVLDET